jgi:hypothetical protein
LDQPAEASGASKTVQSPGNEFAQEPGAALRTVIVEHQLAMAADQRHLVGPGEGRQILAGSQESGSLTHQPEVAEDAPSEHDGIDSTLLAAEAGFCGRADIAAAGDRDLDRRLDLGDRLPVGPGIVSL